MASSNSSEHSTLRPRAIVVCFDGTSGQYDSDNTNVVKLCSLLRKDCPEEQLIYYQPGIGTYFATGVVSRLWTPFAELLDKAIAWYLDAHVMAGYKFLMDNYHAGDKICLFGFSRGAYTARALAGMLNKVGLLPKGNLQQVQFAYKAYAREGNAAGFKDAFSQDVKVDFLGVWDTVQSTGILISRSLPFTDSNTSIRVFRHALSLDERRARFRPKLYHWPAEDDQSGQAPDERSATTQKTNILSALKRLSRRKHASPSFRGGESDENTTGTTPSVPNDNSEAAVSNRAAQYDFAHQEVYPDTDVLEVWFSGCHSDVGGGNVKNKENISLAQIPLRWMVEQIMQSECGICFDNKKLACLGLSEPSPQPQAPFGQKLSGPDDNCASSSEGDTSGNDHAAVIPPVTTPRQDVVPFPECSDAHAKLYDELTLSDGNPFWWILEFLPVFNVWQDGDRRWHSQWRINRGKGRLIPFKKPIFHHSVKERMDCKPLNYKPRAIYDHDEIYV